MGVTLERVQNKFACIIGELCSEPLVLSQFAVWVDLRIAEYKTNGTISLDCSGDFPNPPWMKGMANPKVGVGSKLMDSGQGMYERRGSYTTSSGQLSQQTCVNNRQYPIGSPRLSQNSPQASSSRLSPDVVVIKDEPNLENQSTCAVSRKRHVDSMDLEFFSSIKSRRLDETDQESSTNQSLMSIINTENDSFTLGHVNADDSGSFRGAMDTVQHAQIELDTSQNSTTVPLSNTAYSPQPPTTSTGSSPSQSAWPSQLNQSAQGNSSQTETYGRAACVKSMISNHPIVDAELKSATTIRHIRSAVKCVAQWLADNHSSESRSLENIPPEELDSYLCDFFKLGRKPNGESFRPSYFTKMRASLDRYMKEKGYPVSISHNWTFVNSQIAFKETLERLKKDHGLPV